MHTHDWYDVVWCSVAKWAIKSRKKEKKNRKTRPVANRAVEANNKGK